MTLSPESVVGKVHMYKNVLEALETGDNLIVECRHLLPEYREAIERAGRLEEQVRVLEGAMKNIDAYWQGKYKDSVTMENMSEFLADIATKALAKIREGVS